MNKFIIIALCALATAAAALEDIDGESQAAALIPTDDQEVADLTPEQKGFEAFCKDSRDYVKSDIRTTSNKLASISFSVVFKAAATAAELGLNNLVSSSDRVSKQLQEPSLDIAPATDEFEQIVVDSQERIKAGEIQPIALVDGAKSTIQSVGQRVGSYIMNAIKEKAKTFSVDSIINSIANVCEKVDEYEHEMKKMFEDYKKGVAGAEGIKYHELLCLTTRRISRMDGICKFGTAVRPTLPKLLGRGSQ